MSDNTRMGQLYALADLYHQSCDNRITQYQLCKSKYRDPKACVKENLAMDMCFSRLREATIKKCPDQFHKTSKCYDLNTFVKPTDKDPCVGPQAELNNCGQSVVEELKKEGN